MNPSPKSFEKRSFMIDVFLTNQARYRPMLGAETGPKQVMFGATCVSATPTISGNEKKFLTTEIKICSGHQKTKKWCSL